MVVSRTTNPIHFEDLEPHRFEDLVRQLIYDLKQWDSIEAVGRSGQDEGIDIRATVISSNDSEVTEFDLDEDYVREQSDDEQVWVFQCKRVQRLGPRQVAKIVSEDLGRQESAPHGYALVASCDFSKRSRDVFRQECVKAGVGEFFVWGKGELEDILFRPKYDYLLFAYFGISLQVRKRSLKTHYRSLLTLKRKLQKHLGEFSQPNEHNWVLIIDPHEDSYPQVDDPEKFLKEPPWRHWRFYGHVPVGHLAFVRKECFAWANWDTGEWDALLDYDDSMWLNNEDLFGLEWNEKNRILSEKRSPIVKMWKGKVAEDNQATFLDIGIIPYERIIALDEIGDAYNKPPHLIVDNDGRRTPFSIREIKLIVPTSSRLQYNEILASDHKRIVVFDR